MASPDDHDQIILPIPTSNNDRVVIAPLELAVAKQGIKPDSPFSGYNKPVNEKNLTTFRKIAIAAHPSLPEANQEAYKIAHFLKRHGQDSLIAMLYEEKLVQSIKNHEIDLLIVLGGDGTMLRAGHICGPYDIPILGINAGRFGFLMEIRLNEWKQYLPRVLKGDFWLEKRMMLSCTHQRNEKALSTHMSLTKLSSGAVKWFARCIWRPMLTGGI